jgi:hypothetical protein
MGLFFVSFPQNCDDVVVVVVVVVVTRLQGFLQTDVATQKTSFAMLE